ncbi:pentatricopeptide repeat-containing protein At3g56030, mitochondrial-like [Alnus glutinosa]|uniref:pentatricopeptide repeat-containing protein At3g56030, mitochondrial-like n=1 Tax=Alnus glutinosa TaxID=3517 RepID=UPI002D78210A|nr:pentatricopeptide repeat-containing protein At3g56030, mitochondrial-like [Alnus glutinosa]
MSFLRKLPHKPHNSLSMLTVITRFFTTLNPKPNPFPDVPTSAYYDDLVYAAGRSRDFETLRDVLNKRVRDGCFNTSKTFNFITNTETSLSVLDDLSQTLARLDKGLPRKSAYDSLISRLCKLGRIDESLRVVHTMAREGFGLNVCSFHTILNALTRKKEMERAWGVMKLMREYQIPPDLTAYNYFLSAHCFVRDLTSATDVLTKMVEEGVKADTRTYDALVLGACKAGKVEGALVVLRSMVDDGLPVLLSTHMYVVKALLRLGYYAQAIEFVRIFAGRETWLDTHSFGCLASKLIELERFDEAKLVLEEMNKRDLEMGDKLMDFYRLNFRDKKN